MSAALTPRPPRRPRDRRPRARWRAGRLAGVAAGLVLATAVSLAPAQAETGAMSVPATGRVTGVVGGHCSTPGDGHRGVDIAAPTGTPVVAADDGVVSIAGTRAGAESYGVFVRLHHGPRYRTIYAHLDSVVVEAGEEVVEGQLIGYMGSTGQSSGSHLHFEVRLGNQRQHGINASFRCGTTVTAGTPIRWTFPRLAR